LKFRLINSGSNATVVGAENSGQANVYVADTNFRKPIIFDSVKSGTFNGKNFNMLADTFTLIGRAADKLPADQCVAIAPQPTTNTVITTTGPTTSSSTGAPVTTATTPATLTGSVQSTTGVPSSTSAVAPVPTTGSAPVSTGSTPASTTGTPDSSTTGTEDTTNLEMSSATLICKSVALVLALVSFLL
jgi:hypothetical protein